MIMNQVLSQVLVAEIKYLRRVHGVTLRDKVRRCEIRKVLKVESLLRIKRSQLRSFGHMTRRPQKRLASKSCWLHARESDPEIGQRPRRDYDYISDLACYLPGVESIELFEIAENRQVFRVFLEMLLSRSSWEKKRVWTRKNYTGDIFKCNSYISR